MTKEKGMETEKGSERRKIISNTWKGGEPDDEWRCEIQHDLMEPDLTTPLVVTIYVEEYEDGKQTSHSLACASPAQAREMADALHVYAFFAEKVDRERAAQLQHDRSEEE